MTTVESLSLLGRSYTREEAEVATVSDMHVLIVGGAGYIGSILANQLLNKGWRVRILDNLMYGQDCIEQFNSSDRFSFLQGDVCNLNTQVEAIEGVDCVVFLAEIVGDPSCQYVPEIAFKTNYLAVNSMVTLCATLRINRFIYTSSCSVYGATTNPNEYLTEESELNPVSHYARMKIASEEALLNQLSQSFAPTILRLSTVFGDSYRPRFDLVVNTFAKDAFSKGIINVHGGDQWRPNVHVKDVADAITQVIEAPIEDVGKQIFNIGSGKNNHTISEIAEITTEVFPGCQIKTTRDVADRRDYKVDSKKFEKLFGLAPVRSVKMGMLELLEGFVSGNIENLNDKKYSNIESLKEYG